MNEGVSINSLVTAIIAEAIGFKRAQPEQRRREKIVSPPISVNTGKPSPG